MNSGTRPRKRRSESAAEWWASLNAHRNVLARPSRVLAVALAMAALVTAVSMPLQWHHLFVPNPAFYGPPTLEHFNGVAADSWLIGVAALTAILAIRSARLPPSTPVKIVLSVMAFGTVDGMFIDYFDWSGRGVSAFTPAYYGPGFYVALAAAGLLVVAAVIAWRTPEYL